MKWDYGIMQGRLSPPTDNKIQSFPKVSWREEFERAKSVGLSHIEWIFEADEAEKNPLSNTSGILEIKDIVQRSGTPVVSVCADYFMDLPYLKAAEDVKRDLADRLEWLVVQTRSIGASYIDLPFVDASAITERVEFSSVREFVLPALKRAEKLGVTIALETSLKPEDFRELLHLFGHPNLMANYDTGNSASLGYNFDEEWASYGNWVRTIHLKDRRLHGSTVPLGTGDAPFHRVFAKLIESKFSGPLVLQPAREGDEVEMALRNKLFVEQHLSSLVN